MWGSKSYLQEMAVLNSWLSSLEKQKQMLYNSSIDEWRMIWCSALLDLAQICSCHGWSLLGQFLKQHENDWNLASIPLQNAYGSRISQDQCKVLGEFWRKVERKSVKFFGSRSQIQNSVMINQKTVMIMVLYVMLMMFTNHD